MAWTSTPKYFSLNLNVDIDSFCYNIYKILYFFGMFMDKMQIIGYISCISSWVDKE